MEEALLLEWVVAEVWKRLRERQRKALALFTGGTIGAQDGLQALGKLQKQGWSLKVVMTPGAERALGTRRIAESLAGVPILTEETGWPPGPLLEEHSLILVPVLTVNSAAKMAAGICDNLVTTLILEGLLIGKPVLAAKDACDIDNPVRSRLGMNRGMPALREQLRNNLKKLATHGIQLVPAKELASAAEGLVESMPSIGRFRDKREKPQGTVFTGGVLCRSHVASWQGREITVAKGTVITPLARDLAAERGLKIRID